MTGATGFTRPEPFRGQSLAHKSVQDHPTPLPPPVSAIGKSIHRSDNQSFASLSLTGSWRFHRQHQPPASVHRQARLCKMSSQFPDGGGRHFRGDDVRPFLGVRHSRYPRSKCPPSGGTSAPHPLTPTGPASAIHKAFSGAHWTEVVPFLPPASHQSEEGLPRATSLPSPMSV